MKNIKGKADNLELFDKDGNRVYKFIKNLNGFSYESTYDSNGNELTFKNSNGFSFQCTYGSNSKILTYIDSNGVTRVFDIL